MNQINFVYSYFNKLAEESIRIVKNFCYYTNRPCIENSESLDGQSFKIFDGMSSYPGVDEILDGVFTMLNIKVDNKTPDLLYLETKIHLVKENIYVNELSDLEKNPTNKIKKTIPDIDMEEIICALTDIFTFCYKLCFEIKLKAGKLLKSDYADKLENQLIFGQSFFLWYLLEGYKDAINALIEDRKEKADNGCEQFINIGIIKRINTFKNCYYSVSERLVNINDKLTIMIEKSKNYFGIINGVDDSNYKLKETIFYDVRDAYYKEFEIDFDLCRDVSKKIDNEFEAVMNRIMEWDPEAAPV